MGRASSLAGMSSPLAKAARSTTAPFRNFFNDHFEMVKDEVRRTASLNTVAPAPTGGGDAAAWKRVAELENNLAEQALYQARVLTRLTDDVEQLSAQVDDLERLVRQLVAVAASGAAGSPNA